MEVLRHTNQPRQLVPRRTHCLVQGNEAQLMHIVELLVQGIGYL